MTKTKSKRLHFCRKEKIDRNGAKTTAAEYNLKSWYNNIWLRSSWSQKQEAVKIDSKNISNKKSCVLIGAEETKPGSYKFANAKLYNSFSKGQDRKYPKVVYAYKILV